MAKRAARSLPFFWLRGRGWRGRQGPGRARPDGIRGLRGRPEQQLPARPRTRRGHPAVPQRPAAALTTRPGPGPLQGSPSGLGLWLRACPAPGTAGRSGASGFGRPRAFLLQAVAALLLAARGSRCPARAGEQLWCGENGEREGKKKKRKTLSARAFSVEITVISYKSLHKCR